MVDESDAAIHESAETVVVDGTRGRMAESPTDIPLLGWKDIFIRVFREFGENNLSIIAAGVSFFGLMAVFPAIAAFVALYGLFQDPQTVVDQLSNLSGVIPADVVTTLTDQMRQVAGRSSATLGTAALFSTAVALWSARKGTTALMVSLNVVYGERESRGFIRKTGVSVLLTVAIIAGLMAVALLAVGVPIALEAVALPEWQLATLRGLSMAAAGLTLTFGIAGLYRWAPSRRSPRWRWVAVGSVMVTLFWVLGSILFTFYVATSDNYSATYGSLGAVVILLTWMYITVLIMLVGGEVNAQQEFQTLADTTVRGPQPQGERGAFVADHVAPRAEKQAKPSGQGDRAEKSETYLRRKLRERSQRH